MKCLIYPSHRMAGSRPFTTISRLSYATARTCAFRSNTLSHAAASKDFQHSACCSVPSAITLHDRAALRAGPRSHCQHDAELCFAAHHTRVSFGRFLERIRFNHRTHAA
jgi:hypothetical protein